MNGRILGFHRLARCPKWTPASIRSFTCTMATHCPPDPAWGPRLTVSGRTQPPRSYLVVGIEGEKVNRSKAAEGRQSISRGNRAARPLLLRRGDPPKIVRRRRLIE